MTFGLRVERVTLATSDRLYARLSDVATWPQWAPFVRYSELIEQGVTDPLGAGAVRRMGPFRGAGVDERIVESKPPHYQRYHGVRGFPVSHYRGEIEFNEVPAGTQVVWTVTFEQKVPGTGRLLVPVMKVAISTLADRLIAAAEQPN